MGRAGQNIRQLAQRRRRSARWRFAGAIASGVVALAGVGLLLVAPGVGILMALAGGVGACLQSRRGRKLLKAAEHADRGAAEEEAIGNLLRKLEEEGWVFEFNVAIAYWGDVDIHACSPHGQHFAIDAKATGGTAVRVDGQLRRRYADGSIYPFAKGKDVLKAVRGQAASLKELKAVPFVQPVLCFQGKVDLSIRGKLVEGVYIVESDRLVELLRKLGAEVLSL